MPLPFRSSHNIEHAFKEGNFLFRLAWSLGRLRTFIELSEVVAKHFGYMARLYTSFIFIFGALLLAGCGNDEDGINRSSAALFDQDIAVRDSILTQLAAISSDPFAHAFNALPNYNYTRYIRTEQFNDDAYLIAFRERTVQHEGPVGQRRFTMVASDSSGSYDFGFFRQFVSTNVEEQDPDDLTPYLFPEDPGLPRARELRIVRVSIQTRYSYAGSNSRSD